MQVNLIGCGLAGDASFSYHGIVTFRDRIENDPLRYLLGALVAGFFAGIGTYRGILEIAQLETVPRKEAVARQREPTDTSTSRTLRRGQPGAALSLKVVPNVRNDTFEAAITSLRSEFHVRPLTALESGRRLDQVPNGTYFLVPANYITYYDDDDEQMALTRAELRRTGSRDLNFEMFKPTTGGPILISFTSPSEAAAAAVLTGHDIRRLTLFPRPLPEASALVVLPLDRFLESTYRMIETDSGDTINVLDTVIK